MVAPSRVNGSCGRHSPSSPQPSTASMTMRPTSPPVGWVRIPCTVRAATI